MHHLCVSHNDDSPPATNTVAHFLVATGMKSEWILFTGSPGCGKTTAIQRLVDHIQKTKLQHHKACSCRGFITREVRNDEGRGKRVGFDIVSIPDGHTFPLARITTPNDRQPRTGKYSVDVVALEHIALPALNIPEANALSNDTTIIVLDEIGKMELHSTRFRDAVQNLLQQSSSSSIRLIGTVPTLGKVPFCDYVCQHPFVQVYELDPYNRDEIVNTVIRRIDTEWFL